MRKIGRNDPCPCGSGKKFKKCCLAKEAASESAPGAVRPPLTAEIAALQQAAAGGKVVFRTLGVFILFSTAKGDAWVLESTDMDAVQVAAGGEALAVEIEEDAESISVMWTYQGRIDDRRLVLTRYDDKSEHAPPHCPVRQIQETIEEIRANIAPELLQTIHLPETDGEASRTV